MVLEGGILEKIIYILVKHLNVYMKKSYCKLNLFLFLFRKQVLYKLWK